VATSQIIPVQVDVILNTGTVLLHFFKNAMIVGPPKGRSKGSDWYPYTRKGKGKGKSKAA